MSYDDLKVRKFREAVQYSMLKTGCCDRAILIFVMNPGDSGTAGF